MKGSNQTYLLACRSRAFVHRFFVLWRENQVSLRAAALTYTFILSLVPALALCFAIISFYADTAYLQHELKNFLIKNLATGTGENVIQYIDAGLKHLRFKTIGYWGLGGIMITGLLLLHAIQDAMNRIWRVKTRQRFWLKILIFQTLFIFGPITVALAMGTLAFVAKFFPKFFFPAQVATLVITTFIFASMYKILPATPVRWKSAIGAGFIASIAVEIAKRIFAIYTAKALFYSKVYGALAALPFFLIWIYLNWNIFLSGTQLNYMLDRKENE